MAGIVIAGGDMRQVKLKEMLEQRGYDAALLGFEKLGITYQEVRDPKYVFLPIPYSNTDGSIKAQYASSTFFLGDILQRYPESIYLLGRCNEAAKEQFGSKVKYMDLLKNEAFLVRNAVLTAQAAICVYLTNSDTALCDTTCIVLGYGRIAQYLCKLLKANSADVIATARKDQDLVRIWAENMRSVHTKDVRNVLHEADVIFNTIPYHVLGEEELKQIRKNAKLIELASSPFGTDVDLAGRMGIDMQIESGLPGRYFPVSAANAILEAFIREEYQ